MQEEKAILRSRDFKRQTRVQITCSLMVASATFSPAIFLLSSSWASISRRSLTPPAITDSCNLTAAEASFCAEADSMVASLDFSSRPATLSNRFTAWTGAGARR